jgi:hypothetical protein
MPYPIRTLRQARRLRTTSWSIRSMTDDLP